MDIEQFRAAGYQAIDHICDYHYSLRNLPVLAQVEPGYLIRALPPTAPQKGESFEKITHDYHKLIVPGLMHWQHPRFFAYFPIGSTFEATLAELYTNGIGHNPGFNWSVSPACTELEHVMLDWAAQLLGLDPSFYNSSGVGGGTIDTTASDATLVTTVAARSRYMRQHPDVSAERLVLYTTTQTHSLGAKSGLILGLNVRALEVTPEDNFSLRGATLQRAIEEDTRAGLHPFMLIATVGTTSSGAVDHLGEIGHIVAAMPSLWLHIDAAWAGVALACPEYRAFCHLDTINRYADSFCTNFHKWGLVNFDCSTLWVRDRNHLTRALDVTPEFLRSKHGDEGKVTDYRNWQLGLGKRFRSLKLWFVLRSYGVEGFQRYIRRTIQLSETFVSLIEQSTLFQLVAPPSFSLSVFRLEPPQVDTPRSSALSDSDSESVRPVRGPLGFAQLNALNRAFHARLAARDDVAFTRTDLNGTICVRCAVGAERTEETDVLQAFETLYEEAIKTLEDWVWDEQKGEESGNGLTIETFAPEGLAGEIGIGKNGVNGVNGMGRVRVLTNGHATKTLRELADV